jgi:hypothetical protein
MLTLVTEVVTVASAAGSAMPPALGKDQARRHWQTIYGTFPDMRMDAVDLTMDGDTAFAEISHGGTMQGPMGDKAPTVNAYNVTGAPDRLHRGEDQQHQVVLGHRGNGPAARLDELGPGRRLRDHQMLLARAKCAGVRTLDCGPSGRVVRRLSE